MRNVFPHHDLYKKRKKTLLLLNISVFREYNQIRDVVLLLYEKMNKQIEFFFFFFGLTIMV